MNKPPKVKFPRAAALEVAKQIVAAIKPHCVEGFLKVAGSLRRDKPEVGDVEIVYVPAVRMVPDGFFETRPFFPLDDVLETLIVQGMLARRANKLNCEVWGPKNKLAIHCQSLIPVDFFATTVPHFWNYLVCRTGGEKTNIRIAKAAQSLRLKWHPYGAGFEDLRTHEVIRCESEEAVFKTAGLNYLPPYLRA